MPFDLAANIAFQKKVDKLEENLNLLASELPEAFPFLSIVGRVHYTNSWRRTIWLERFTNGKTYPTEFNKTASKEFTEKNLPSVAGSIATRICNELYGKNADNKDSCGFDLLRDNTVMVVLRSEVGSFSAHMDFDPLGIFTAPLSQCLSLPEACVGFVNEVLDYEEELDEMGVNAPTWRFLSGIVHKRVVVVSAPVNELRAWGIEYPTLDYSDEHYRLALCPN